MLTMSTHDTKRSEDVRARLAVLAEVPDELTEVAQRVAVRAGSVHDLDGHTAWVIVQSMLGVWPASAGRLWPPLEKTFREAKLHTSWLRPDPRYEAATAALLDDVLDQPVLRGALERLATSITPAGWANSLVLLALRCTLPGIPDTYQGGDRWQLTLVDPDNRRPIDLTEHASLLAATSGRTPADCWAGDADDREQGGAKQALLRELLQLRRRGGWTTGPYEPIDVVAAEPTPAAAYRRDGVVVVAPRFPLLGHELHRDAELELPGGHWRDVCSGERRRGGRWSVAGLTDRFPVAVLERER